MHSRARICRGRPETVELSFFHFKMIYETQINEGSLSGKSEFEHDIPKDKVQMRRPRNKSRLIVANAIVEHSLALPVRRLRKKSP